MRGAHHSWRVLLALGLDSSLETKMARFLGVFTLICILASQSTGKKHKQRDSVDNPDEQDYMRACEKVSVTYDADPNVAKTHINNVLQRLQNEDLLPSDNPIAKARTICEDPAQENSRVCVFLRKNDMIDKVIADFALFEEPGMARRIYLVYWCKHPECVTYTRDCHSEANLYEGLHGYTDCTDEFLLSSTEQAKTVQLRAETHHLCSVKRLKIPFCLSQEYIQIGDKCRGKDASFDFLTEQQFNRAILLNTLSLKAADPELFLDLAIQPTNEAEQQLLADNLDMIFNLFNAGNYDGLAKYMQLLPDTGDITPQCTNLAIAAFDESKQRECILGQVLDQTRQFLNTLPGHQPTLAGKNRKLLNTMINYKTYLQQSQISEILGIVQNQQFTIYTIADNLKKEFDKSLGERFQGIKTYFSQVEGFNKEIARADIGYIKGTLDIYQEQVNVLAPEVGQGYVDLLNYALATASLQLAQTTVNLALQIYDACNPLKTLFGGGAAVDVLAALDEVAQAISQLADAGSLLAAWDNLKRETNSIVTKLAENTRFLETVKAILDQIDASETSSETFEKLKQEFLAEYNNYSPKVTKPELTAMTALWEKVIERACGVIEAADKTTSVAVQTYVNSQGYCWKIPIKMQRLTETYEEIYDFQFDLMDAMAAYVRASTAVTSAGDMNENYEMIAQSNPDNILYFLQQLAALTYLSNKMEKAQVVENYCDVLQYKQGGQRPAVCSGESTDIPTLIAYEGTGCTADLTYQNVPIEPSSESDRAFLNLTELFLGNPVTFQIPNGQWLVSHGWINEEEVNNAYFLNKFEVYLPTESQRPRRINVVAKVTGGNKLAATSSTEYLITPPRPLEYTYSEGRGVVCRQKTITNPYRLCESDAPSDICPQTAQDDECEERPVTALDASVYAQWSIRLSGYPSKRAIPDPATPVSVRVGVGLCKVSSSRKKNKAVFRDSKKSKKKYGRGKHVSDDTKKTKNTRGRNKKHWSKHMMRDVSCCGDGLYWSASDSSCQPCPDDSVRRLHGYYCDKNTNTM